MDRNTRNDPYWNRCVFLGASGVFESDETEDVCEGNGTRMTPQNHQTTRRDQGVYQNEASGYSRHSCQDSDYAQRMSRLNVEDLDPRISAGKDDRSTAMSGRSRYQADLDSYLEETYGKRG